MKKIFALQFCVLLFSGFTIAQVTHESEPNNLVNNSDIVSFDFNYDNKANADIGASMSSVSDTDMFQLNLAEGYHYSIYHDMEDGNSNFFYDASVYYYYKINNGEWSEAFNSGSFFNTALYVAGPANVYFMVKTKDAVLADTGNYYLQLDIERQTKPFINVSPTEISGTYKAIHQQIIVNATAPYTIASSCGCAGLDKYTGTGIDTFYLDVDTNFTSNYRIIQLTVTAGDTKKYIAIKQAPYIKTDRFESNDGSNEAKLVELMGFVNDTACFEINDVNLHSQDDIDYYKIKFPVGYNYLVNFAVNPDISFNNVEYSCNPNIYARLNNSGSNRYGKIAAKDADSVYLVVNPSYSGSIAKFGYYSVKGFVVRQTEHILQTNADTFLFAKSNSDQTLNIYSTTNWTSTDDAPWLGFIYGNGSYNGSYSFSVNENTSGQKRTGHISVNTSGGISQIVTIIQEGDVLPDTFETNNSELTATPLEYFFVDNKAIIKTFMVNLHASSDTDYYKIKFPAGSYYNVSISKFDRSYNTLKNEKYSGKIKLYAKYGNGIYEEPISHLSIYGNDSMYIKVSPYGAYDSGSYCLQVEIDKIDIPFLAVSRDTIYLDQFSLDEKSLKINSNIAWKISNESDWIGINERYNDSYTKYGYFGFKNDYVKISSQFENDEWARDGNLLINAEGLDPVYVYVYQASPYKLSFAPDTIELAATGPDRITDIQVSSNLKWEAYTNISWLSLNADTCYYDDTITVTAAENTSVSDRFGEIRFEALADNYLSPKVLTVKQSGTKNLIALPENILLGHTANAADTVRITSNTSWSVSVDQPWLSLTNSSGTNNGEVICTATENTADLPRTATITVSGDGVENVTINVTQKTAPYLTVSADSVSLASLANSKGSFVIQSNIIWNITCDQTWLTPTYSNNTGEVTITVTAMENTSSTDRTAIITISGPEVLNQTVKVVQDAASGGTNITSTTFNNVRIYPNPAKDKLNINGIIEKSSVQIIDINGNIIMSLEIKDDVSIPVKLLPNGTYLITVCSDSGIKYESKFLKTD